MDEVAWALTMMQGRRVSTWTVMSARILLLTDLILQAILDHE
jgi:hypothetical protein